MKSAHTLQKICSPKSWAELPWGEYYRAELEQRIQPWWSKIFGFHLLKIGCLSAEISSASCPIAHQVNIGEQHNMQVIAHSWELPFAGKAVDGCLIAHELAYSIDPHSILREIDRVLNDDGWLLVTYFNPISLVGLGKLLPVIRHRQPHISHLFSQIRLFEWLGMLNYEVIHHSCFQVLPWHRHGGKCISTHLPLLGCLGLMVARKRTIPLTLRRMGAGVQSSVLSRAGGAVYSIFTSKGTPADEGGRGI